MSLRKCLKKMGLSRHEAAIMRAITREHHTGDRTHIEAAKSAVGQRLKELRAEKESVHKQVEEALRVGKKGASATPENAGERVKSPYEKGEHAGKKTESSAQESGRVLVVAAHEATLPESERRGLPSVRGEGHQRVSAVGTQFRDIPEGPRAETGSENVAGQNRSGRELRADELPLGDSAAAGQQPKVLAQGEDQRTGNDAGRREQISQGASDNAARAAAEPSPSGVVADQGASAVQEGLAVPHAQRSNDERARVGAASRGEAEKLSHTIAHEQAAGVGPNATEAPPVGLRGAAAALRAAADALEHSVAPPKAAQTTVEQATHEAATSPQNNRPLPTEAQKEAGNYKLGHVRVLGLDISIENPVGSVRNGIDRSGKPWAVKMSAPYGYLRGTKGRDKEHIDVYLGPHVAETAPVFVFDQIDPATKKFDEHKVVLGTNSEAEAQAIYDAHFQDKSGPERRAAVQQMSLDEFKQWLKTDTTKPVVYREVKAPPLGVSGATAPTPQEGLFSRAKVTHVDKGDNESMPIVYRGEIASAKPKAGVRYYTEDRELARIYAHDRAAGSTDKPVVKAYQLAITNPAGDSDIRRVAKDAGIKLIDDKFPAQGLEGVPRLVDALRSAGFDGVIGTDADMQMPPNPTTVYVVFDAAKATLVSDEASASPPPHTRFSRGEDRRSLFAKEITRAIAPVLAQWKNAPEVSIINSMDEAPQAVKLTYMRQQEGGAVGAPEAFIYRDKVYLVADGLSSPEAATRALLHESVGHFGLRQTFGERLDPILDEVAKSLPNKMKAKAREYGLNLADASERRQAAEEVLAQMAQEMPHLGVVKKLIAAIRQFLRDIGVHLNLSDNDIIANYILPARALVERGQFTKMVEAPAFSRMSDAIETARQTNYKQLATGFVDRLDQALNPLGTLPEQEKYLIRRYEAQGTIEKADEAAKAIREALPAASEADQAALFDYLTTAGANSGSIVDPVTRHSAEQIKADINRVGDELVAHGLLSEESRAQYRDAYLPRLYLKHLLSESDWKALGAGKKPSDMGYLKARKDIPEDVRKVILGEVRDPGFLAAVAVAKPMRDMALLDWLSDISQNEKWILPGTMVDFTSPLTGKSQKATPYYFKNEAVRLRKQARYYAPEEAQKAEREAKAMDQAADDALEDVQGTHENYKQIPNTARYGRLRGMLVRSEIYDDLMGVQDFLPTDPGWFQNVFGYGGVGTKATQIWKAMKVSMNPPAQIRNFVSNGIAMQLFAGVPLRLLPARVIQATRDVLDNGKYFQIAKKYGIGASTFATQEVYRMKTELLDLEMKTRGMGPLGRLHRLAGLVMNKAGDFYQTSETIFKTATIIDAMERQGMSEQQAVLLANKALFDYSLVQKSLRYARSAPIGVPFATYAVKVLPRLVETALHHPERFIPWVGLFYGFPMMVASMLHVDKDDLDKLKKAMPQWLQDKGHALILPYKDEQGRWQVIDLGYFMPWTNWTELGGNIASGELGKAVQGAGIFGGPLTDIITAIKTGKDPFTGKDILAKGDPPERQTVSLLNYVWDMAMPPIITDRGLVSPMGLLDKAYGGKLEQALSGTTNKFGEPRATATQALLYAAGVNVNALTPEYTRATNLQAMQRDMQDVKTQMVQKLYDRSLTDEQRRDIAKEYATELIRRTEKMKKYMRESEIAPALAAQH